MSDQADPSGFNLSRWAIEHAALTRYLLVALMVIGLASYFQLGQDEDPPFTFRTMVVKAVWPGASPQQMADQVADKIERTLQEINGVDKIRSFSKAGELTILFNVSEATSGRDVDYTWYTIRKKVSELQGKLPPGVGGPFFNDEFGDVYGTIYALESDGFSPAEVKTFADDVRQRLLRVHDVRKVELFGVQDEKIYLEISHKRLAQLGLDLSQVLAQLNDQNAVESAGSVQAPDDAVQVRVAGAFFTLDQLRDMPIRASSGKQLRLGDIAHIQRDYADPASTRVRFQGKRVIALGISMAKGGDIVALGKNLRASSTQINAALPAGIRLVEVQDQPEAVIRSVDEFIHTLIEAVVIVLAVSFLSLGLLARSGAQPWYRRYTLDIRPGLIVGITIPLVLAVTFLGMYYCGIGLHKISLGALIIALGLLVDDAIIAVEMMVRKMEEGYDKVRAATFAYEVTAMPMLTGTLITSAGFLPIGIAKSVTGEYTFAIFAVTVMALVLSWIASVYFVPYLGVLLLKKPEHHAEGGHAETFDSPFYGVFRATVNWCVRFRWITIGLTVAAFALGIVGMGQVPQQFFPDSSRPELLVDMWFPEGTAMAKNEAVVQRLEARVMQDPSVETVTTWVGSGVPRFYLPLDAIFPQANVSQMIVVPKGLQERDALRTKISEWVAQEVPEVRVRVKNLPNGPPVAYPVQFRVIGDDPAVLRARADEVKDVMRQNPNARGVNDNWNESVKVLRLEVDQDKARALGVTSKSIAQASQLLYSGRVAAQYREGDKLIDIVLRQPLEERDTLSDLGNTYVATSSGKSIPLNQIAKMHLSWEPGVLWRDRRNYAITTQCDIAEGLQGATVTQQMLPALRALEDRWRAAGGGAYRIEVAGAVEESSRGSSSIVLGIPIMLFTTFTLLMLQLQSFSRAVLVFLTGPMGIVGVAVALLAFNRPFGFVAMLGVIALMGMIQRNSVILIDQIEQERARGVAAWDAIIDSAVGRLRPIVLTAAAAVLAMIPLTRSVFWGPMAVAIMGGLILATVLTLLALPAMYAAWFRVRR
jgi:multidrug efflux pump subunit AcrB